MHLRTLNWLLQDDLATFEVAGGRGVGVGGYRAVADVVFAMLVDRAACAIASCCAAFGAGAQSFFGRKINDFAVFLGFLVVAKVKLQLEVFGLVIKLDDHLGHERPARFGAEAVQGPDVLVVQKLLHFGRLKSPSCGRFAKRKPTSLQRAVFASAGVATVVFFHNATAVGARCGQRGVVTGDGVAVVFLGLFDHALGHGGNFGHELLAAELAVLHLRELVLPLAGEFGFGQLFHAQTTQQGHELKGLGGGDQLAAFAQHVLLGNQALDDAGAGGGRAQAFFAHGLAQLVVVHRLAGVFHGAQQGGLRVACGRLGFQALGVYRVACDLFVGGNGYQVLALVTFFGIGHFVGSFLAVNGQPARLDQDLAFGSEVVTRHGPHAPHCVGLAAPRGGRALLGAARRCGNRGYSGGHLVLRAGEEDGQKAAHHQVINLLLSF